MQNTVEVGKIKSYWFIFLCWLIYTSSYIGKLGYSANIVPIENFYGVSHAQAGLVSTFFFFSYGAGQIVNGIFCKKYPLKYTVTASLAVSAVCNLLLAVSAEFVFAKYIWLVNGCALSTLWPSMVRFLAEHVDEKFTAKAVVVMGTSVAAGTFLVYGLSSLFVKFLSFKAIFYTACVLLPIVAVLWLLSCPKGGRIVQTEVQSEDTAESHDKKRLSKTFVFSVVTLALFAVATNLIKDGLTTWSPSILKEVYNFDDSLSILLTLCLPVFAIFGTAVAVALQKKIPDFVMLCTVIFAATTLFVGGIVGCLQISAIVILICFSAISCLMAGTNNVITSMAPLYWKDSINSGLSAGLLNGCCYIGSALSSYVLGGIADQGGWNAVFTFLLIVGGVCTVVGFAAYFIASKMQKQQSKSEEQVSEEA